MRKPTTDPFQAIADPSRREILYLLSRNSHTINSLADNFDMSRPAVSKHIKILHEAGFIMIENLGRERHCLLNEEGFHQLRHWIDFFDTFWKTRLRRLEALLKDRSKK